ncbi:hypothetical protein R6Z07M_019732 [Ovis aries]
MDALDRVVKPKTKRAKRFLEKREPKLSENIKNAMLIKGGNANSTVTQVLRDVYALKKPYGILYKKIPHCHLKNITRPFEDQTSLEFFSKKSDCSLFMFGSHNKKRPNNLVIGRMYDYHVLDMIELGIEKFVSLKDIKNSKCPEGTKPMLIFAGDDFDVTEDYKVFLLISSEAPHQRRRKISHDTFGTTYGRIHMQKQDLSKLQTRKMKGLKKRPAERKAENEENKSKRIKKN